MTFADDSDRLTWRHRPETAAWAGSTAMGIVLVILGVVCAMLSTLTGLISMVIVGAFFVAGGIAEIIAAFQVRRQRAFLVLTGILSVVVGVALVARPLEGLAAATLLLSSYFVAGGLFRAVSSVAHRHAEWGWELFYGVVSSALGVYLLAEWSITALWLIGTLVGVELVVRGVSWIGAAMLARRAIRGARYEGRSGRPRPPELAEESS